MAKIRRRSFDRLPLSETFYAQIGKIARALGVGAPAGPELAQAVAGLSRVYTRERAQISERAGEMDALAARLEFFLPRDLVKIFGPLGELLGAASLPATGRPWRVLDVGAGLGATSLGVARWLKLRDVPVPRLEVTALERDRAALGWLRALGRELRTEELVPCAWDVRAADVAEARFDARFDLVLFGFVLNELFPECAHSERIARRAELLLAAAAHLTADGALIVLEPALKDTTRDLMRVRDVIAARAEPPFVFAPCVRSGPCPMLEGERDWCHEELAYALPPPLAAVAQQAGLRYEGLSYAALVLRNTPRAFASLGAGERRYRVVSERLDTKGKLELYGCGDAGCVRLSQLTRDSTVANAVFEQAQRGDVIRTDAPGPRIDKASRVQRER